MFWSLLFSIGIVQGSFLIVVFAKRSNSNRLATRLLMALLALFALSNFDDLLLSSGWYKSAPWLFGYSMGALFAYGPLLYLYIRAVTGTGFSWRRVEWLHFLPALLSIVLNMLWMAAPPSLKVDFLDHFESGTLAVRPLDTAMSVVQILYLGVYIWLAHREVRNTRISPETVPLKVSLQKRATWLRTLMVLFTLILMALAAMFAWNISTGSYLAKANYAFTLVTSTIIYFIAYKLMLQPELVTPGFSKKYPSIHFEEGEEDDILLQLKRSLEKEKIYTNPDLKLGKLASQLKVPPHRLSMLINENYGKPFSDFINEYRVEEFIARLNDPRFAHLSLHGLALEVGFNSKSAFNAAFKKITGKPPSAFKKARV